MLSTPGARTAWSAGLARLGAERIPAAPEVLYDLASLTKPLVTTTLFLLLRREGRVDLDTPAERILPELSGSPAGASTCGQLLTHTSGLPAWAPLHVLTGGRKERTLEALSRLEPIGRPGGQVVYSCPGFILLGLVLERLAGEGLAAAFGCRIAGPLGLDPRSAGFLPDPGSVPVAGGAARPSVETGLLEEMGLGGGSIHIPPWSDGRPDDGNARFLGGAAGNAGLWGTAAAVAELAAEYIPGTARLLERDEILLATRNHTPGLEQGRGLGWQLASTEGCSAGPALPPAAFGHTGFTGTSVWIDPVREAILVLLTNRHHPGHRGVDLHPLRRRFHALALEEAGA